MHLTSLRIRGFKSFADPVELRLFPGVAVVVGPNGSGKSNIADAIQWAMASQPPSQLRAETGLDVLFAGSERRAGSALCEVELVLANDDGRIALPHAEVSVMRRLRRDGESDYLLGRQVVRRLDVQEALADAGLGRELHGVISQGTVDEILLSRPEERRGLVEEAAGLGKFKRRRRRAEQKLARVRQDLDRAADVEREIRTRLGPLRLQATAAERAEKLAREIAEGRLLLLASEAAAARARRAALSGELEALRAQRQALEANLAGARGRREAAEGELASLASQQERESARFWGLGTGLERLAGRREALLARLDEAARDAERARQRAERLDEEAAARLRERDEAAHAAESLAGEAAALDPDDEEALRAATARAEAALETALEARRAAAEAQGAASTARSEHERLSRRSTELERVVEGSSGTLAQVAATLGAAHDRLAAAAPAAAAARDAHAACEQAAATGRADAERVRAEAESRREAAALVREQAAAAATRVAALDAALERADGVAPAVRRLAEQGATLALSLVRPESGLELAVAAALERRAATAVARDLDEALALLPAGAEGASVLVPSAAPRPGADAPRGAEPLAARVRFEAGAPDGLLGDVWLVEDASALAHITHGLAVTRSGLGWDADRGVAFRSGSVGEAALLQARAERDAAGADHERLTREGEKLAAAAAEAQELREGAEHVARESQARLHEAAAALLAAEREEREAIAARDRAAHESERAESQAASAAEELAGVRRALGEAAASLEAATTAVAEAVARAEAAQAEQRTLDEERRVEAQRVAARRAQIASLRERATRARDDASRAARAADQAAAAVRAARTRAERLERLAAVRSRADEVLGACAAAADAARAPARAALEAFEQRAGDLSAALAACRAEETDADAGLRRTGERSTVLEIESAQLEERLSETRRRARELAERHGLAVVEATAPVPPDEVALLAARLERSERRLEELGAVNPLARQEYDEQVQRADDVAEQRADLEAALRELEGIIRELSQTIQTRFAETYEKVERGFAEVVGTLFPGGRGRLTLVEAAPDEEQPEGEPAIERGIELEVQPAGKRISSLGLLSGGEKALAALAFLFALFLAKPSPFYVLDEVDAPLDDANIERFLALLERYRGAAQFIVISHQKRTMEVADVLYGVTMAGDGVSKVLSRKVPETARRQFTPIA